MQENLRGPVWDRVSSRLENGQPFLLFSADDFRRREGLEDSTVPALQDGCTCKARRRDLRAGDRAPAYKNCLL